MASSGPSFFGGLLNLAKEIVQAFFGSSPAPAVVPAVTRTRSVTVKEGRKKAPQKKSRVVIDLTSDYEDSSSDVEIIEVRGQVQEIDLTYLPEPTVEELEQEAAQKRQRTVLIFGYAAKLGIAPKAKLDTSLQKLAKDKYQIQSAAFAKYNPQEQAKTLEQLVALTENMDLRDAQMLLRNEWLNDTLVEKFFRLLEKQDPKTRVVSPLLSDKSDFCERVRNDPDYIYNRASLKSAKRIFMPMNANNHWYLVVLDKGKDGKYTLSCLDSFNTKSKQFLTVAANFLQALFPKKKLAELVKVQQHINIPEQDNALDCGVSISYWAREIVTHNALPKNHTGTCDYSQFRFDMAEAFAQDQTKILEKEKPIKKLGPGGKLN
ncbi:MAG: Ulp1 family isopeptidase [Candidatus Berkiella sp.]